MTSNGEVHINEEAQVYVQDLDLFVTVQLLENTPAVVSIGKLCSEHEYSYEWISGQNPRLTKTGNTITCTMDNFVPLVEPGLKSSSSSSSASTSRTNGTRSTLSDLDVAKEHESTTIGMSTEREVCQIHGQVSRDLRFETELLQKDTCGPGRD